ncbi:MAG: choice-of-anchor L domain-containing protein [Bacteroidia bacterium]|nr:choice-of-anchor L domain-containing protein [Bacteroidia bacterium]
MKNILTPLIIICLLFITVKTSFSQLVVSNALTPAQLVQNVLLGPGITVSNITFSGCTSTSTGAGVCIGQFSNGNTTNLGLTAGIVMSTGSIFDIAQAVSGFASTSNGAGSDPQLAAAASATIYDATVLEFDFVPFSPQCSFRYVFGSEEYPEYVNAGYNDAFGFFITGPNPAGGNFTNTNIALIPGTTLPVTIDNVNSGSYATYFIDNQSLGGTTVVYDGFTTVLTASCSVVPCQQYHIKLAVGDAGDAIYDSGIFLEAGSFAGNNTFSMTSTTSNPALSNNAIENCSDGIINFNLAIPQSSATTITYTIGGTATNGVDYTTIPSSITIPAGSTTAALTIHPVQDALTEGNETVQLIVATPPCGFDTIIVYIQDNSPLVAVATNDMTVCNGDATPLNVNVTGGITPYTYLWSNGATTAGTTVYPTGIGTTQNYSVTATDACIHQASDIVAIYVDDCTPCTVNAGQDGKICGLIYYLQATTQPGDYNTQWSSSNPSVIFSNFSSPLSSVTVPAFGTYAFVWTVTNVAGATCSDTVSIIFAPTPTSVFTVANANCFGDNVVVTYTGNAPANATYTWNFGGGTGTPGIGQGPHNVIYPSAGNFDITLSVNDNGCVSTATTHSVNNPPELISTVNVQPIPCPGTYGSVNMNVTGGTPPYIYTWSNGPTPPTSPGNYSVTVTDLHGCTDINSFVITAPQNIVVTPSQTNLNCYNDATGSANVSVSGGTPPYTYGWSNNPGLNSPNQTSLQAGIYVVSITDDNTCQVTQNISITQPPAITVSQVNLTNVSCAGGSDGSILVNAGGGTYPIQYSITGTLQPTGSFQNLAAGNYSITVIDSHNCSSTYPFNISEPSQVALAQPAYTHITCYGLHNGTITASATGGTGSLHYSIGGGSQLSGSFAGLYPGNYIVSVTDDNGCSVTSNPFTITQPPVLLIDSVVSTNLTCYGSNNGTAVVYASGGTPPLQYASSGIIQSTGVFSNIPAGNYIVTVTDFNGCTVQAGIVITQPQQLVIASQSATPIACFGDVASVSVVANGGTPPLVYSMNGNIQSNGYYTGLHGGYYTVTVTDSHGCFVVSNTFTITEPPLVEIINSSFTNVTCNGLHNGTVSVTATGGTTQLQYSITPGIFQTGNTFTNLNIGNYTLVVTDANSCKDSTQFTLTEPTALSATVTGTNVHCFGEADGSATLSVNGGVMPYSLFWSNGDTTLTVNNLQYGIYFVSVTDANNCGISDTILITQPQILHISSSPDTSICKGEQAIITAHTTGGTSPYIYLWNGSYGMSIITPNPTVNTLYNVYAIDVNGCISDTAHTTVGIIPDVIINAFTADDSICSGTNTPIYFNIAGGLGGPYSLYENSNMVSDIPFIVSPTQTHTYTFFAYDRCPTPGRDTLTIYTLPLPNVMITADNYKGCQPFTVNFIATTIPQCQTFIWNFGEGGAFSFSEHPQYTYQQSGIYDVGVAVTTYDGCTSNISLPQLITVYPKPDSRFTAEPEVASILKPEIYFTNLSTAYCMPFWSFGDGDSSMMGNPVHLYDAIGTYNVSLLVQTMYGCKDTSIATIVIKDEVAFYVPTAFTPDNDGINDIFLVKGHGIDNTTFLMQIYDRWGEIIFESKDINTGWDGRIKGPGAKVKSGTYTWIVSFNDYTGKKHLKSGPVTVIR